jgi:hypothetical protein
MLLVGILGRHKALPLQNACQPPYERVAEIPKMRLGGLGIDKDQKIGQSILRNQDMSYL